MPQASQPNPPHVRVLILLQILLVLALDMNRIAAQLMDTAVSAALLLVCAMVFSRLPQLWLAVTVFE